MKIPSLILVSVLALSGVSRAATPSQQAPMQLNIAPDASAEDVSNRANSAKKLPSFKELFDEKLKRFSDENGNLKLEEMASDVTKYLNDRADPKLLKNLKAISKDANFDLDKAVKSILGNLNDVLNGNKKAPIIDDLFENSDFSEYSDSEL